MAIKQNFVTGQGETFSLNATLKDSAGTPVDLTGHTITLSIREDRTGPSVGEYPATVDDEGNISIKVTDELTEDWPTGNSVYMLIHNSPDGDVKWLAFGTLTVKEAF